MSTNFTLQRTRHLAEFGGTGRLYRHISGAQIFALANNDENRVCSISFCTPPPDETGLPHVLEHTVLAGSRKYPLKEPFNELLKGSLYTYLNAMTYRTRTVYPIASRHPQDFLHLAEVYLDAVFNPLIYSRSESFWQEGHHLSLPSARAALSISGIVYNEMQGAYSDPCGLMQNGLMQALFPRSPLRFDAAGNPAHIPELTREAMLSYHQQHYTPANAYIYLYGKLDLAACFAMLDTYLSNAQAGTPITMPTPVRLRKPVMQTIPYAATGGTEARNILSAGYVTGDVRRPADTQAQKALAAILFGTEASPIRQAVLAAGLGEDVSGYFSAAEQYPVLTITVQNAEGTAADLREVVENTATRIVREGLSPALVDACLNRLEFRIKEADHGYKPKGLAAHMRMLPCWMHGGNPFAALSPAADVAKLRKQAADGLFEQMLAQGVLQNNHKAFLTLTPDADLAAQREAALQARLAQTKADMGAAARKTVMANTKRLARYQAKPDSKRALAAIPMVSLWDIKREAEAVPIAAAEASGIPILTAPADTADVAYTRIMFRTDAVPACDLPYLGVLGQALGKIDTQIHSFAELANEIGSRLGGLRVAFEAIRHADGSFAPYITIWGKALAARLDDLFALAGEVACLSLFTDAARLRTVLLECKAGMEEGFLTEGHVYARRRAEACLSEGAVYTDAAEGIAFYEWLCAALQNFDIRAEAILDGLRRTAKLVFTRNTALIAASVDNAAGAKLHAAANGLAGRLPEGQRPLAASRTSLPLYTKNEAFITASRVQYNVLCADMHALGYPYHGALRVLQNVAGQGFLMDEIRLMGGAYGCGAAFGRTGLMHLYSYRDPNLTETYRAYAALPAAMARFAADDRGMQRYILGAVNALDRPPRPGKKAEAALLRHMSGITDEMMQKERAALLGTTAADIRGTADMLEACVQANCRCTFGAESAIAAVRDTFEAVRHLHETV